MKKRNFVIRTIRNGQVKINGRIFKPSSQWLKYDGRLDGMRYAFGLYWRGNRMEPFVNLWGTEEAYRVAGTTEEAWDKHCDEHFPEPGAVYDEELGNWYYPWDWWDEVS